ncbi:MAG: hypothetical protein H6837_19080 [Planctomycetes bacterium]|nr:hypothetical protein [Planctomycetota bacterium]
MRTLLVWLGLAGLACAAVLAEEFYGSASTTVWCALIGVSVPCLAFAPVHFPIGRRALWAALLVAPAAVALPWSHAVGPLLILVGSTLSFGAARKRWLASAGQALSLGGMQWLLMALVLFVYQAVTARVAEVPSWMVEGFAMLARLAGVEATADGASLVLFTMRTKHALAMTWSLVVDPASACLLAGGLLLLGLVPSRGRAGAVRLLIVGAVCAGWLVLRTAVLFGVYLHRVLRTDYDAPLASAGMFFDERVVLPLVLPVAWLAARVVGRWRPSPSVESVAPGWRAVAALGLAGAATAVLTLAVVYKPSGARKGGRVVFDEYHSRVDDWSRARWPQKRFDTTGTLRAYDMSWHGEEAAYNYGSLYEYCSRFYTVDRLLRPTDDAALAACDVLVVKVPSRTFDKVEIDAIQRFVTRGGGLLLIGEHTAVFGSGASINQLARPFGFTFRYDCLFGMDDVFQQRWNPPLVPHPVTRHMSGLDFAVSCSIDPGLSAGTAVMQDNGLKSLDADFHVRNFYPQPGDVPQMLHGSFVQLWATERGAGRVLAFTDSTIFANFGVFEEGKSELFLGMVEWLNRRAAGAPVLLWVLGLLLAFGACAIGWPVRSELTLSGAAVCVAGFWLATSAANALHAAALPVPEPRHPVLRVAIERRLCPGPRLTNAGFLYGKDNGFGLFERAVQRLTVRHNAAREGVTWRTQRSSLERSLEADVVVMIHPTVAPSAADVAQLERYVAGGGQLWLLDSPSNARSTANRLLTPFGLSLTRDGEAAGGEGRSSGFGLPEVLPVDAACTVRGGRPLTRIGTRTVASWLEHGKGRVVVVGFAKRFCDTRMGVTGDVEPTPEVRKVYAYQHALLRRLVSGGAHGG